MRSRRILLLHDSSRLRQMVRRVCGNRGALLHLVASQTELLDALTIEALRPDLVVAKDVGPDWFNVASTLIAARAFGVTAPFIVVAEPSDRWTYAAVESVKGAIVVDDRSSMWLVPLLLDDWLAERSTKAMPSATPVHSPAPAEPRSAA